MPYRTKKTVKKTYRKKSFKVPKSTKRYVKKAIQKEIETKYIDYLGSVPQAKTPMNIIQFTNIPQGITDQNRIGDVVTLRGIRINLTIDGTNPTDIYRVIFFQWKPNTSLVTPTGATLLADVITVPWLSPYFHDLQSQVIILWDKTFTTNLVSRPQLIYKKKIKIKWAKKKISFLAGSSFLSTNAIFMATVSDSVTGNNPTLQYYIRVYYDDA